MTVAGIVVVMSLTWVRSTMLEFLAPVAGVSHIEFFTRLVTVCNLLLELIQAHDPC